MIICNKVPFNTKADAMNEAKAQAAYKKHFTKRSKSAKDGRKLKAYECPHCGKWHLTTRKQKKRVRK